ncbi:hypothetical protein, partial [Ligilactobacillus agilis]|uniref:hypothetical protein n=1 Tax=Ligilactobacillus agilis TaxID=1601 RepID=UPI0019578171
TINAATKPKTTTLKLININHKQTLRAQLTIFLFHKNIAPYHFCQSQKYGRLASNLKLIYPLLFLGGIF